MVNFLKKICKLNFGEFEDKEFRKFLRLGTLFLLLVGIYWTMRPFKDGIFIEFVNADEQPWAKLVSLGVMLVLVAIYSNLVSRIPKEKLLSIMPAFYGVLTMLFSIFVFLVQNKTINDKLIVRIIGYSWYVFVESFGSLIIALFWAYASSITIAKSAKQGFPLIYALGQVGGILFPLFLITIPQMYKVQSTPLAMAILSFAMFLPKLLIRYFIKHTPEELRTSTIPTQIENKEQEKKQKKASFTDGLKLLLTHKYLFGIFLVNFFFEFVVTIFDFNFKYQVQETIKISTERQAILGWYSVSVNTVSLIFLLLGVNQITKRIGMGVALACTPVLLLLSLIGFVTMGQLLMFLLVLMVSSKAINYALNGPSLKQLYIPTSQEAKSQAQAWIETFGSRSSKVIAGQCNLLRPVLGTASYIMLGSSLSFLCTGLWLIIAIFLGKTYKKAIDSNSVIC
ncbi:MAG: hypothetical protein LBF33_03345 [Oscillospiraceae bacterium]|jgi:AAA family ATP:ADP antiporter|nr:hypothetical protein [Oscillospiraceae bacterium]